MDATYQPKGWCRCGYRVDPGVCPECGRDNPRPLRHNPRDPLRRRTRRLAWVLVSVLLLGAFWLAKDELAIRYMPVSVLARFIDENKSPASPRGRIAAWANSIARAQAVRLRKELEPEWNRRVKLPLPMDDPARLSGEYRGGGNSARLRIRANDFEYSEMNPYTSATERFNFGRIEVQSDHVRALPALDGRYDFFSCPTEWVRVRWGGAEMLVDVGEIDSFCGYVNNGWAMSAAATALRADAPFDFEARPELPIRFEWLLLDEPVELSVTEFPAAVDRSWNGNAAVGCMIVHLRHDAGTVLPPGTAIFFASPAPEDGCLRYALVILADVDGRCVAVGLRDGAELDNHVVPQSGEIYCTRDPQMTPERVKSLLDETQTWKK